MVRFATLLTLLLVVAHGAIGVERSARPLPLDVQTELFVLLNARPTDLRLFVPSQSQAKPLRLLQWDAQLDAYARQWNQKKQYLSDQELVEQLFYNVHRQFLKKFIPYAGLQALLETGEYNCLSATALYALLLERLGYSYDIVESVNHIVLLVNLPQQQLLLETTDPVKGFISTASEIDQRLSQIKNSEQSQRYYNLNLKVFRTIGLRELAGLQFYNHAAWYYNQRDFVNASLQLRKGKLLYKSERFDKVADLLLSAK